MDTLFVAAVAVAVGLVVAVFGTRLFYVLLPLWGFLTGFVLGADLVATVAGEGLLATFTGWLVGGVLAIVLAATAALWFYGAVFVLGVGFGLAVVSGLAAAVGLEPGLLTLLAGVAAGGAVGVAVIVADGPTLLISALTGYTGALWATAGVMLLLGRVHVADLHGEGPAGALRGDALAVVIAFALGTAAFVYQARDLRARRIAVLRRDGYRF